jgi:DNA invertase Pin-like site-specific DNA recombinase
MPAFAYLRKSHVGDPTREVSHEVQEQAVRALAKRQGDNGTDLVVLSDWDISGKKGRDQRPGYDQLLTAIEDGRCTALYSYSLSRLGRSVAELARLIGDCVNRGVPVRLHADAVDTSTASGMLLFHVLAAVAQFESDVASERVRGAIKVKRDNGEWTGTSPTYGERPGEDAQAVLTAFHEARSYSGAAKLLNERGVRPRNSKKRVLKQGTTSGETEERPVWWPSSVAVVVQRLEPQAVRQATRGARAGRPSSFSLARVLRCPTCGTSLTGTRDRGGRRVRYACRLGSVTPHPRTTVSEHLIMPAIRAEAEHLRAPSEVEAVVHDQQQRAALEAKRERVIDAYVDARISKVERDRRLTVIDDAFVALDERRVVLAVPSITDIDWEQPAKVNPVLKALFQDITLDAETFQPAGFTWRVPEWRA